MPAPHSSSPWGRAAPGADPSAPKMAISPGVLRHHPADRAELPLHNTAEMALRTGKVPKDRRIQFQGMSDDTLEVPPVPTIDGTLKESA